MLNIKALIFTGLKETIKIFVSDYWSTIAQNTLWKLRKNKTEIHCITKSIVQKSEQDIKNEVFKNLDYGYKNI